MRLYIHIVFPFFVMAIVYALLSFFFGATGVYSQKKLEEEVTNVVKNINEGESIIKLTSLKSDPLRDMSYGSAITIHKAAFISDSLCKRFAFLMGLVSLIIEILILKSYDSSETREKLYSYN